jgi:hypothetical protein
VAASQGIDPEIKSLPDWRGRTPRRAIKAKAVAKKKSGR